MMRRSAILVVFASMLVQAQQPTQKSQLDRLAFFVGQWQGTSQGEPGFGQGEREYALVLGGRFLQLKNKSTYPPQQRNPKGEIHEDFSLFSYDKQRKTLVLRQFHGEGFVNEYVEQEHSADGKTLVFVTERIENIPDGWRARETYTLSNPNEFTEVFELAEPGKDFARYSESH